MTESHVEQYRNCRQNFEQLCIEVKRILVSYFLTKNVKTHSIENRAKSVESFERKLEKTGVDGNPKYTYPLKEITDLAAVRVITHTIDDINDVIKFIDDNFIVIEKRDVGEERAEQGQFGYQSIHYLVQFTKNRLKLPENEIYEDMTCEIQVRTILQHAWAEMEHSIQYKGSENIPKSLRRKFLTLAGLLEIADREFSSIQREDKSLRSGVLSDLQRDLMQDKMEGNDSSQAEGESGLQVRDLLAAGKFKDAIKIYNSKIEKEPNSYTLYIGRARALFLSGQTELALKDLDCAESLQPDNKVTKTLREKIEEGSLTPPNQEFPDAYRAELKLGDKDLVEGRPQQAYRRYREALAMGASWPFMTLRLALASMIAGDLTGAELHLKELSIYPGTPMEINIVATKVILSAIKESKNFTDDKKYLTSLRKEMKEFNIGISPLYILKEINGENIWDEKKNANIQSVIKILE